MEPTLPTPASDLASASTALPTPDDRARYAAAETVLSIPDLLCFWEFAEPTGTARVARGAYPYALRDGGTPVARVSEGIFGPHAADFQPGSWLRLPAPECPALNLHGHQARVTVVAWLKRRRQQPEWCDAVAGLWDEGTHRRQYCLFLALGFDDVASHRQVCGHVSAIGGKTPGFNRCNDAASGATPIRYDEWVMAAFTYDGHHIRAYLNGSLDEAGARNPYHYPYGIHEGGDPLASDFTVGAVHLPTTAQGPRIDPATHMGNWYSGLLGGLAVFRRALSESELSSLHRATLLR